MARPKNPYGVQAKIEELVESPCPDSVRTTLNHYIDKTSIFKEHMVTSRTMSVSARKAHEFIPGADTDNLICNVLELHMLFKDSKTVEGIVDGGIDDISLKAELEKSEEELRKRFASYAYWIHRISSLKKLLKERGVNFSKEKLADILEVDGGGASVSKQEPFMLRAVQHLEGLEESGRLISPTADSLAEKATAMMSLGSYDRAEEYAVKAIELDQSCSQAWFVRTVVALEGRKKADEEFLKATIRNQDTAALSSEERWTEDLMEQASNRAGTFERDLRVILPQAIIHWPKEKGAACYVHDERRIFARDKFVEMMFRLANPLYSSGKMRISQVYALHGLSEEFEYKSKDYAFYGDDKQQDIAAALVEGVEKEALDIVFGERDEDLIYNSRFYGWRDESRELRDFKLLHLRYVTKNARYEDHLKVFFERIGDLLPSKFGSMFVYRPWINTLYTSHSIRFFGEEKTQSVVEKWRKDYDSESCGRGADVEGNRLRSLFHYHFVRKQYPACVNVAKQALHISDSVFFLRGIQDHTCEDGMSRTLDKSFWTYLMIRAAIEQIKIGGIQSPEMLDALLAVEAPRAYFAQEESYGIAQEDDFDSSVFYIPPYGESLLETSEWVDCLNKVISQGLLEGGKLELAKRVIDDLIVD